MADFHNTTPFGAFAIPSADRAGRDLWLIVAAARFTLSGGQSSRVAISPDREPPPRADAFVGEPGVTSMALEGQSAYTRPATDIYVRGHASAPAGQAVRQMDVGIRVGPCFAHLRVVGDRIWERTLGQRIAPSPAQPFARLPLVWERAFGGVAPASSPDRPVFEARNPIGCGLATPDSSCLGARLPNIENPQALLSAPGDRPLPVGVGPIARAWQPRLGYAGTYDDTWRRQRAPLWPQDFDERFFCAAPDVLQARPHLRGGESVILEGLRPEGTLSFLLPTVRLATRSRFLDGRVERRELVLDGVLIDADALELTLYLRTAVPASLALIRHRETLLRVLEPWEEAS